MIAELLLLSTLVVSAPPLPEDIDRWTVLPNRTILAHLKGTPENLYEMYWIQDTIPCKVGKEPVPVKPNRIVLATSEHKIYQRWCYIINVTESIMRVDSNKGNLKIIE